MGNTASLDARRCQLGAKHGDGPIGMPRGDHDFRIYRGDLRGVARRGQELDSLIDCTLAKSQLGKPAECLDSRSPSKIGSH